VTVAVMILVNNPGNWEDIRTLLTERVEQEGFRN
jgi:hypothetical protein